MAELESENLEQVSESFTNRFATMLSLSKRSVEEGAAIIAMYAAIGIKGKVAGQQAYIARYIVTGKVRD